MEIGTYAEELPRALTGVSHASLEQTQEALVDTYARVGTVYIMGNGGSASNASHFAQDLTKATATAGALSRRLRAVA